MSRQCSRLFGGSENTPYDTLMMDTGFYTFVHTHRVNQNVNYGLWVMMCPCGSISCNTCTILVGMLIMKKAMHI